MTRNLSKKYVITGEELHNLKVAIDDFVPHDKVGEAIRKIIPGVRSHQRTYAKEPDNPVCEMICPKCKTLITIDKCGIVDEAVQNERSVWMESLRV